MAEGRTICSARGAITNSMKPTLPDNNVCNGCFHEKQNALRR